MSQMSVNKENLRKTITNISNEYPTVFDNLKNANNTFDDMKNYWYGERYQKMISIWNEIIKDLNSQLKVLSEITRTMSVMLKNYTSADLDTMSVAFVSPKKLTSITAKSDKNINIDTNRLKSSNDSLLRNLKAAKESTTKIINYATRADWKSPAVDKYNAALKKLHTELQSSIEAIRKSVDENLTTTVAEFKEADTKSTIS